MHYKDYIHHDFYVYSPVLLTQYLGHCWHTPCTELYILGIRWLAAEKIGLAAEKTPLPCYRGGNHLAGGGLWGSLLIYIYIYVYIIYIYTYIIYIYIIYPNVQGPGQAPCGSYSSQVEDSRSPRQRGSNVQGTELLWT